MDITCPCFKKSSYISINLKMYSYTDTETFGTTLFEIVLQTIRYLILRLFYF